MILRFEPWGAWIKLDTPPAIVALDRAAVRALGHDGGGAWREDGRPRAPRPPIEVHLAVTARCAAGCSGCYVDARPDGDAPPLDVLRRRLDALADDGVFTVALG